MPIDPTDFCELMDLASHGNDIWVGESPTTPWGRMYGGHVAAQALRAAQLSVDGDHLVHSLHGYFIRGGDFNEPVRYLVDRIRNGRSFTTRRVVAMQSNGAIFNLSASFQRIEDQIDLGVLPAPGVPMPDDLDRDREWTPLLERWTAPADDSSVAAWFRVVGSVEDDPELHACALTFASDDIPTEASFRVHPDAGERTDDDMGMHPNFVTASLDHSIWFHRPGDATQHQLHTSTCQSLSGGRGLNRGDVFSLDGRHLATVQQQVLIRRI